MFESELENNRPFFDQIVILFHLFTALFYFLNNFERISITECIQRSLLPGNIIVEGRDALTKTLVSQSVPQNLLLCHLIVFNFSAIIQKITLL
jgi:hypothetical protein